MSDSLIGRRLGGRYRVDERLGSGAMGDVYRGYDERLQIPVAIKVITARLLDSERARADFRDEALKLARIKHGNVAAVYDSSSDGDLDYIVMEYVSGVTMDQRAKAGPLPEAEVVRLGVQLAQGMRAAHEQGIVHSDLKPANVRVTEGGTLKILDFGIARKIKTAPDATATEDPKMIRGTIAYMPPEQMRGGDADARSDIYSAGVLLFEVATGQRPFPDKDRAALFYKVPNVPPPRPRTLNKAISPGMEAVLLKCLQKDPQDRFPSAEALERALQSIGKTPGPGPIPPGWLKPAAIIGGIALVVVLAVSNRSTIVQITQQLFKPVPTTEQTSSTTSSKFTRLAVLPFRNLSGDASRDYISDGIADELSTRIGKFNFGRLRVIGFPATIRYKQQQVDIAEIKRSLGVDYILDGSVKGNASALYINTRLSDTVTGAQCWSHQYHGTLSDALASQQTIADSIAASLAIEFSRGAPRDEQATPPSDAGSDHFLRGQFHVQQRTDEALTAALADFQAAIASDPNQAPFHAQLARTHVLLENYGYESAEDAMPRALSSAKVALALDSNLAIAHVAMASVRQDYDRAWKPAESEYQRALTLDPSSPAAHEEYASLLLITGRNESALEQLNLAAELDPLSLGIHIDLGAFRYLTHDHAGALEQFDRAIQLHPEEPIGHYQRGVTLLALGRQAEAIEAFADAMRLEHASETDIGAMRRSFKTAGVRGYWHWKLQRLARAAQTSYVPAFAIARAYAALGDSEKAFQFLDAAADQRESALAAIVVDPVFEPLRKDARFAVLRQRLNLPPG